MKKTIIAVVATSAALLASGTSFAQVGTAVKEAGSAITEKGKEGDEKSRAASSGPFGKTYHKVKGKYHASRADSHKEDAKDAAKAVVK